MAHLVIASRKTEDEIYNYRLGKQTVGLTCKPCGYKWVRTIEDLDDNPECPRCKN